MKAWHCELKKKGKNEKMSESNPKNITPYHLSLSLSTKSYSDRDMKMSQNAAS